jgi:glycosyltransferase involved in cell wall biosynthesis
VFLQSAAFRALDDAIVRRWAWPETTVLYISHGWNPARDGAQSITGRRLVHALLRAGARVHVLAAGRADDEIHDANYTVTVIESPPLADGKVGRAAQMLMSGVPEAAGRWVPHAVAAGTSILKSLPSDTVIYGRTSPGASNIAAWHLARRSGLPWVAHFSDEWPPLYVLANGRRWLAPYKWPLFELWRHRIIRDAGALTFSNPGQGRAILGRHAVRHKSKAFVVTHVASRPAPSSQPPQYDTFHLAHSGNLYPGQSARPLLEGLRRFLARRPEARACTRVTQAGWSNGDFPAWASRLGLERFVTFTGRLGEADLLALLDDASLLLALDYARPTSTTVLSKIPDYVSARRPILAIAAPTSSLGRLFDGDGAGLRAHYDDPGEIADRIEGVFDAWRNRSLDRFLPQAATVDAYDPAQPLAELAGAFSAARDAAEQRKVQTMKGHGDASALSRVREHDAVSPP